MILNGYKMNKDSKREGEVINHELTITDEKDLHHTGIWELAGQPKRGVRSEGNCEALKKTCCY